MGGGGGGGSGSLGDTSSLEQRAKEILKQGEGGRKNVFISFAYEDLGEVNLLRGQAKNEDSSLEFNDRSVKEPYESERAEYIRQKLRERINQCSTTIVYLSKDAANSPWVKWEVEKSLELGKRVIAVHKGDHPPDVLPSVVRDKKIEILPWSKLSAELRRT
jgi:hypothetical protein